MRFAYAGIDMMSTVFATLLKAGWTPVKLFTRPCNNPLDSNTHVVELAGKAGIPAQLSPICDADLANLGAHGTQCLIVAGYPWKVLGWEPHLPYALNFHPSPLPEGARALPPDACAHGRPRGMGRDSAQALAPLRCRRHHRPRELSRQPPR